MTYTSHGHHIPGTILDEPPARRARCGGIALCDVCSKEANLYKLTPEQRLLIAIFGTDNEEEENMSTTLQTRKYVRKPFEVEAVQVTAENMAAVALWCDGQVKREKSGAEHIEVKVHKPLTPRQSMAKVGDWVLFAGQGFKVYTPRAFDKSFDVITDATPTLVVIPSPEEREAKEAVVPAEHLITVNIQEDNAAKSKAPSPASLAALVKAKNSGV